MNCPVCAVTLNVLHREGIEIDMCPRCRGVWLDRGELEKILERSSHDRDDDDDSGEFRVPRQRNQHQPPPPPQGYPPQQPYPKKRESWWGNLFD
ncbi:MAG: zf-TFIIB domain-containing protein, partial [Gemmataceae bacterium]